MLIQKEQKKLTRKEQEKIQIARIKGLGLKRIMLFDLEVDGTTLCLLFNPKSGKVPAMGLAIQSPEDFLDRREGRVRATARALRAFDKKTFGGQIDTDRYQGTEHQERYSKLKAIYSFKSNYECVLRPAERKAVKEFAEKIKNDG